MTETLRSAWEYALSHPGEVVEAAEGHILLVLFALAVAIGLCVPLGILTARSRAAAGSVMNLSLGLRVIPTLAVLFLAIPYFGVGFWPAALALVLLALPPVLVNTDAAFRSIDPAVREAAVGMGMSRQEVLRRVEFPLALPTIFAGIRTATTEAVASATLAGFIGAQSFGTFIVLGFAVNSPSILLVGAIPVAAFALATELFLGSMQKVVTPPGGRSR